MANLRGLRSLLGRLRRWKFPQSIDVVGSRAARGYSKRFKKFRKWKAMEEGKPKSITLSPKRTLLGRRLGRKGGGGW